MYPSLHLCTRLLTFKSVVRIQSELKTKLFFKKTRGKRHVKWLLYNALCEPAKKAYFSRGGDRASHLSTSAYTA